MAESMKDFEKELQQSLRTINVGDMISGTVVAVSDEEVTLDLNYYAPGIIKIENLSNDPDYNAKEELQPGDVIEAAVISTDDGSGNIELSKKEANDVLAWEKLLEMKEQETIVSVRIKESVPAGVTAYLEGIRAFIPASQICADYVEDTNNHVLDRVTPILKDDNLLASGVQMEAYSVEDKGKGVCFNVYCYNVQPDISINYTDGSSKLSDGTITSVTLNYTKYSLKVGQSKTLVATVTPASSKETVKWYSSNNKVATVSSTGKVTAKKEGTVTITAKTSNGLKATCKVTVKGKTDTAVTNSNSSSGKCTYVLNTNTKKFHLPSCSSVDDMKEKNKKEVSCSREEVIKMGYEPCKRCNP